MGQRGQRLKKYGQLNKHEHFNLLLLIQCAYSFLKSTKDVFCLKGALLSMVHGHAFPI